MRNDAVWDCWINFGRREHGSGIYLHSVAEENQAGANRRCRIEIFGLVAPLIGIVSLEKYV